MMQRASVLALTLMIFLTQTGCGLSSGLYSNYRAIEQLRLVRTLGVDAAPQGVKLSASAAAPAGGDAPVVIQRSARDLISAADDLQDLSDAGQLFFAHTQSIVLGRAAAEQGIAELLDLVERDVHLRMGTQLFVLREGEAAALASACAEGGDISAALDSVRQETAVSGKSRVRNFRETAIALEEYGAALVCALRTEDAAGQRAPSDSAPVLIADGYGIIKDGRLVAFIDGDDAEAVSLLCGDLGTVSRMVSDGCGGTVTLELCGADASVRAVETGDADAPFAVAIQAELNAVIAEQSSAASELLAPEMLDSFSAQLAAQFRQDIENALALSQTLDADFLALAKPLRLAGASLSPREVPVHLSVEARIVHSYEMEQPVPPEKAGAE